MIKRDAKSTRARVPRYRLTPDAEDDLLGIARETTRRWGAAQAERYQAALVQAFEELSRGVPTVRAPIPHRPNVLSLQCERHVVIAVVARGSPIAIVAILHEKMDIPARLQARLMGKVGRP